MALAPHRTQSEEQLAAMGGTAAAQGLPGVLVQRAPSQPLVGGVLSAAVASVTGIPVAQVLS